jgi:hypothetical protein
MKITGLKSHTAPTALLTLMLALLVSVSFTATSKATTIVSPGFDTSVEGNSNNLYPFGLATAGVASQRYQQVYNASDFLSLTGPLLITQIAFRPDVVFGTAFSSTLPNIRIDLSTTTAAADGLSLTFANNVGLNDTIVFSGALTLSSAFTGPAAGPKDFDIVINLTSPFLYDPTQGNLLMDVRNFGGGSTTVFDAQETLGDAVSRVSSQLLGVDVPTGEPDRFVTSLGLVTRFSDETQSVPDSISWWVGDAALFGVMLISLVHRRRQLFR